ncbi:unnamed protein product [Agarophyton chilense]
MEEKKKQPVFIREIANHIGPLNLDKKVVLSFRGSLLIRHPAWVAPSFHRVWPEFFKEDMVSFHALADIFTMMKDAGEDPVVIEAHDLRNHPEKVVKAWCEHMGIPFVSKAIKWEKGMPEDWKPWAQWFTSTSESTGFLLAPKKEFPPLTEKLARIVDANRPLYLGLEAHKLQV